MRRDAGVALWLFGVGKKSLAPRGGFAPAVGTYTMVLYWAWRGGDFAGKGQFENAILVIGKDLGASLLDHRCEYL